MSTKKKRRVITEISGEHPAVRAWTTLQPTLHKPDVLELLRPMNSRKNPIFRLVGSGIDGSSVIAKRSDPSDAMIEANIYENALGYLSTKTIHYYGHVRDDNESDWWFFTEDAGEIPFSFENQLHTALAVEWLADLHTSVPELDCLPDRGLEYYRSRLVYAQNMIVSNWSNPALRDQDRAVLKSILTHFDNILSRWEDIDSLYEQMPKGLIHADFKARNLRIRNGPDGDSLLVFDWEDAGWGLPGVDIWRLDLADYWIRVRERWKGISFETIMQLSSLGKMLWCFNAISWQTVNLQHEWLEKPIIHIEALEHCLAGAMRDTLAITTPDEWRSKRKEDI